MSTSRTSDAALSVPQQVNRFVRTHLFVKLSLNSFTKSERRQFERDVYDFGRSLGLEKSEARKHVLRARTFCGEEEYDSDKSSLSGEIDDLDAIRERLALQQSPGPASDSTTTSRLSQPSKPSKRKAAAMLDRDPSKSKAHSPLVQLNEKLARPRKSEARVSMPTAGRPRSGLSTSDHDTNTLLTKPWLLSTRKERKLAKKAAKKQTKQEEQKKAQQQVADETPHNGSKSLEDAKHECTEPSPKKGRKRRRRIHDNDTPAESIEHACFQCPMIQLA